MLGLAMLGEHLWLEGYFPTSDVAQCTRSVDAVVLLLEGDSEAFAQGNIRTTDPAGDDHRYLSDIWEMQGTLDPPAVEALYGTSVIALLTHGEHEGLRNEGTALM